ncbi:MAG: hypothetical protein IJ111_06195 [Eggerthellaceae bacterium]|nr:hypothetical protein [Eggerthellaceae bacterium]
MSLNSCLVRKEEGHRDFADPGFQQRERQFGWCQLGDEPPAQSESEALQVKPAIGGFIKLDYGIVKALGLNPAIFLGRLDYLLEISKGKRKHEQYGRTWVWNSYQQFKSDHFPFWSTKTIERIVQQLENSGIVLSRQWRSSNRTKLYSIDYDALRAVVSECQDLSNNDSLS